MVRTLPLKGTCRAAAPVVAAAARLAPALIWRAVVHNPRCSYMWLAAWFALNIGVTLMNKAFFQVRRVAAARALASPLVPRPFRF